MSKKSNLFKTLPAIILSTLLVVVVIYAWTEPSSPPPSGNVSAPLNVSGAGQSKLGALTVSGGFESTGITLLGTGGANVGIGTTSPTAKLQVDTTSTTGTGRAQLGVISNGWWGGQGVGNYFGGWSTDASPLFKVESWHGSDGRDKIFQVARTGDTPYLTVQGGGNVGIGTASPGQKLTVAGTIESTSGGFKFPDGSVQDKAAGGGGVLSGAVMSFNLASCPSGWTELTSARGRYIVGLPSGGTLAGTVGTALTNLEDRPVGQHTHGIPYYSSGSSGNRALGDYQVAGYIQSQAAGSVAGTNAPYIQLLTCQKN